MPAADHDDRFPYYSAENMALRKAARTPVEELPSGTIRRLREEVACWHERAREQLAEAERLRQMAASHEKRGDHMYREACAMRPVVEAAMEFYRAPMSDPTGWLMAHAKLGAAIHAFVKEAA